MKNKKLQSVPLRSSELFYKMKKFFRASRDSASLQKRGVILKQGFTLIETLIAVFILATSISALLVVTGGGLKSQNIAKERLAAQYLAQEGVELVRNVRDTFELTTEVVSSIDEVTHPLHICLVEGCTVDPISFEVEECGGDGEIVCPNLVITSDGVFGYGVGTDTNFQRVIVIESKQAGRAFTVTSTVKWGGETSASSVTYKSDLFSWM